MDKKYIREIELENDCLKEILATMKKKLATKTSLLRLLYPQSKSRCVIKNSPIPPPASLLENSLIDDIDTALFDKDGNK